MDDDKAQAHTHQVGTDSTPLGRSVEEVEDESGNRVNPDTPRETVLERPLPPAPVLGGVSEGGLSAGNPAVPELERERGADTTRPDAGLGDESSDSSQS